jgi:hypothetical protein
VSQTAAIATITMSGNGSDHLPLKAMLQLQIHDRLFEVVSSIDDTKNAVEEGGRRQVITEVLTLLVTLRMLLIKSGKGGENQTEATQRFHISAGLSDSPPTANWIKFAKTTPIGLARANR